MDDNIIGLIKIHTDTTMKVNSDAAAAGGGYTENNTDMFRYVHNVALQQEATVEYFLFIGSEIIVMNWKIPTKQNMRPHKVSSMTENTDAYAGVDTNASPGQNMNTAQDNSARARTSLTGASLESSNSLTKHC